MKVAIITMSDSGFRNERIDLSGPAIKEIVEKKQDQVVYCGLLPDEQEKISAELIRLTDEMKVDLILTTGGTGFSQRDVTPEATLAVIDRVVPGIPEAMRAYSIQITKRAMLSRAVSGIRGETLIVNLPGSPKAVKECLTYIYDELIHGVEILTGKTGNCAR